MKVKSTCPKCGAKLGTVEPDWVLEELELKGHKVAHIGTASNAPDDIALAVRSQIGANLAAYKKDSDAVMNPDEGGAVWIRCPQVRPIGKILWPY